MASLLSFRKNANGRRTASVDSDDEDDGWVHGGRYVPAARTSTQQPQQRSSLQHVQASSTPSSAATEGNIMATHVAAQQPSPYSMLSPPPLNTPLPSESAPTAKLSATHSSDASFNNGMPSTTNNNSSRTPMTVQLQRLLQPTPSTNTPHAASTFAHNDASNTSSGFVSTPTVQQSNINHHLPAATTTPMGKFLLESGVPPTASLTIGQATSYILSILFNLLIILYNTLLPWILTSHECFIKYIWNNLPQHAVLRDLAESLFEITIEGIQFLVNLVLAIVPYILWIIQTCIALVLTVGGTILYGIVLVVKGSKSLADGSSVGVAQLSALNSLRASVQNSPFVKKVRAEDAWTGANWSVRRGGRLPFMGFSGVRTVERNVGDGGGRGNDEWGVVQQQQSVQVQQGNAGQGISVGNGASTSNAQQQHRNQSITSNNPVSNKSTTPIIRSSTLRQQTPYAGNANARGGTASTAATPATARRVLFSETAHGQVTTERFSYDKNLPASARKVDHRKLNNSNQQTAEVQFSSAQKQQQQQQVTPPKASVCLGTEQKATTKPAPPKVAASSAASSTSKSTPTTSNTNKKGVQSAAQLSATKKAFAHVAKTGSTSNNATAAKKNTNGQQQQQQPAVQDEEQRKQQYIKRYGLLPSITPLSKRYGRMKQQGKSLGMASSSTTSAGGGTSNNAAAASSNNRQNIKRKRRGDLLGAASRIGRTRRARLTGRPGHSSLPSLSRATPMKRPREDGGMSRADELVWKAMNSDGEKENRRNEDIGGVAKRGKFSSSTTAAAATSGNVVGTPPKNPTPAPIGGGFSISTPPKTPGPSNFSLGSATPAPKKSSDAGATPAKPSIPFSFGADDSNAAAPAKKDDSASGGGFTFGAKPASVPDKKDAAPGFSFGSTAASEKKDATSASAATAPGFSFNASTTATNAVPPAAEKKEAAPAFAFGNNTTKPAETSAPAPAAGFMFGGTATAKPEATPAPSPAPAAGFSFGGAAPAMPEASKTKDSASGAGFTFGVTAAPAPAPGLAFGNNTAPSAPTATQPKEPASSGGFAFGSASAPSQPAANNPPTAGFSFGSTGPAAPTATAPAAPAFGFGAAAPAQPAPVQPAAFSFGGGAAAPGVPAAPFGAAAPAAAANSFSLGGDGTSRSRGGSVRRREKKAGGRRK